MGRPVSNEPIEHLEARLLEATGDAGGLLEVEQPADGGDETPKMAVMMNSNDGTTTVVTTGWLSQGGAWVNVARVRRPMGEPVDLVIDGEMVVESPTTII